MGKMRNACNILIGKPEGKRPLGRHRHRQKHNIKMDFQEIGHGIDSSCLRVETGGGLL
jgi:hypothetical protein